MTFAMIARMAVRSAGPPCARSFESGLSRLEPFAGHSPEAPRRIAQPGYERAGYERDPGRLAVDLEF